ncbi:hypothetical protein UT300012_24310 [Paraclostridium bifermentans]
MKRKGDLAYCIALIGFTVLITIPTFLDTGNILLLVFQFILSLIIAFIASLIETSRCTSSNILEPKYRIKLSSFSGISAKRKKENRKMFERKGCSVWRNRLDKLK